VDHIAAGQPHQSVLENEHECLRDKNSKAISLCNTPPFENQPHPLFFSRNENSKISVDLCFHPNPRDFDKINILKPDVDNPFFSFNNSTSKRESNSLKKERKMKLIHLHRKPISVFVMVTFTILLCFWANQAPAAASSPAAEKNSAASLEKGENESTNFIEQEEDEPVVKKGKKFPWLIVGAVVIIGAAALYFLVLKKTKYTLTVSLSGATGNPPATAKYKKDSAVAYSYTAQSGYVNLQVKLDGVAVAASGTVKMDKDHTLSTSATQGASIQVNSTPAGAKIYIDKADSGHVTPYTFNYPAATTKVVLLRHQCGYQEWTQTVTANLGQEIVLNPTLKAGIFEDFEISASACWLPRNASSWSVSDGQLKMVDSTTKGYEFNVYNYSFPADFTIIVKQKVELGNNSYLGVTLSTDTDMTNSKGYEFDFSTKNNYYIYKNNGYNFVNNNGPYSGIKYGKSSALNAGIGVWNIIKIVKAGSNYSFYANDTFVFSFVDAGWDPRYISLDNSCNVGMKINYDSVLLTTGSSSASVPGLPVNAIPATTDKLSSDR
jgi:flagellar basal body-associated protein FliL